MNDSAAKRRDPFEDASRPELVEGLNARFFDTALLKNPTITEAGEMVMTDEGEGQLVRIPLLEGISWNIPINLVLRNPKQPREYFDEAKMRELEKTIGSNGQEEDLHVIPIKLKATGEIKLFILDGERRYRVMKDRLAFDNIKAKIRFVNNFWELYAKSFMVNESRAPQNPIERAKVYKFLLDNPNPQLGRKMTVQELADHLGTTANDIYIHLRLISDLDEEIQRLIITDRLPRTSALQLASVARNLGSKLDQAKLARRLLKLLHGEEEVTDRDTRPAETQALTLETVNRALRDLLVSEGEEEAAQQIRAKKAVTRITDGTGRARFAAREMTESDPGMVIAALRERATPPEAIADEIRAAIAELSAALSIVEAAAKPSTLAEVADKPKFADHIEAHLSAFRTDHRKELVRILAKHSDTDQAALTSKELEEIMGIDAQTIAGNYRLLIPELAQIGLKLEKFWVRRLDEHDEYKKVAAYRIAWNIDANEERLLLDLGAQKAAGEAEKEAEETRNRVLAALGASRRSTLEEPTIAEDKVPPVSKVEGKPKFLDFINTNEHQFHSNRLPMALVLAQEADGGGKPLSALEIATKIKDSNSIMIANNIRFLKKEFEELGIVIEQFTFLRQNELEENIKITCYRLAWTEAKTSIAASDLGREKEARPAAAPTPPPTRPAQPAPAHPAPAPALARPAQAASAPPAPAPAPASARPPAPRPAPAPAPAPAPVPARPAPAPAPTKGPKSCVDILISNMSAFEEDDIFDIVKCLAEATDSGETEGYTVKKIAEETGLEADLVEIILEDSDDLEKLNEKLAKFGMKIVRHIKPVRYALEKIEGEADSNAVSTGTAAPTKGSAAAATQAPAALRPKPNNEIEPPTANTRQELSDFIVSALVKRMNDSGIPLAAVNELIEALKHGKYGSEIIKKAADDYSATLKKIRGTAVKGKIPQKYQQQLLRGV